MGRPYYPYSGINPLYEPLALAGGCSVSSEFHYEFKD